MLLTLCDGAFKSQPRRGVREEGVKGHSIVVKSLSPEQDHFQPLALREFGNEIIRNI